MKKLTRIQQLEKRIKNLEKEQELGTTGSVYGSWGSHFERNKKKEAKEVKP